MKRTSTADSRKDLDRCLELLQQCEAECRKHSEEHDFCKAAAEACHTCAASIEKMPS